MTCTICVLNGLPGALGTLFGTGHFGYKAAHQWGKVNGADRR
ncbi:hypothetical protein [Erythrobacter crassostreae]|nr:hypothetical protein [Erythrobacter crassostrea]